MSFEPLERAQSDELTNAKIELADYIVYLEDKLEEAEGYGHRGDSHMFVILREIEGAQSELEYYSKKAHESMPIKNYEESAQHIALRYLPKIVDAQIITLKGRKSSGEDITGEIDELTELVSFYANEYEELGFDGLLEKIEALR